MLSSSCRAGMVVAMNNILFNDVCEILKKYTPSDILIASDSLLIDDLNLTSLDIINIIVDIEDKYNIEVKEQVVRQIVTVDDIIKFLELQ